MIYIIANWKCNPKSFNEAKRIFNLVKEKTKEIKKTKVIICPPFVFLPKLKTKNSKLQLGAQNCFWEDTGAFDGEVSVPMLKSVGCKYIIVGHSERRRYFKETDSVINKKMKAVMKHNLKAILCVGETKEEKRKGKFSMIISRQITKALKGIPKKDVEKIRIAYEPVWAIGSGKPCRPVEAQVASLFIKRTLSRMYTRKIAEKIPILYGGSVNRKNAIDYLKEAEMNGLLIGGASLRPQEFVEIIKQAENV
ncbi:triose-phosphate isomerase, partial [bacterium]|nr:triose-phosphate isomerase [bacterium]